MEDTQWPYSFISWRCVFGIHNWDYFKMKPKTGANRGGFYTLNKKRVCSRCGKESLHYDLSGCTTAAFSSGYGEGWTNGKGNIMLCIFLPTLLLFLLYVFEFIPLMNLLGK